MKTGEPCQCQFKKFSDKQKLRQSNLIVVLRCEPITRLLGLADQERTAQGWGGELASFYRPAGVGRRRRCLAPGLRGRMLGRLPQSSTEEGLTQANTRFWYSKLIECQLWRDMDL